MGEKGHSTEAAKALTRQLIARHADRCTLPGCCMTGGRSPLVITERFSIDEAANGGWENRPNCVALGRIGEHVVHLALPEARFNAGIGIPGAAMDANTPRGELEVKTALPWPDDSGRVRHTFSLRIHQRRPHALPVVLVALREDALVQLRERPVVMPGSLFDVVPLIQAIYLFPAMAFPVPQMTVTVPDRLSRKASVRAVQRLFRVDLNTLADLGIEGLCRLRGVFRSPSDVRRALRFVDSLGSELTTARLREYQRRPHRWLADAEAFARGLPVNRLVRIALAKTGELEAVGRAERFQSAVNRIGTTLATHESRRRRENLAFALLAVLTLAADRPLSAVDMRFKYGIRRDRDIRAGFTKRAKRRQIPVAENGERVHQQLPAGEIEVRHLTRSERLRLKRDLGSCLAVINGYRWHPLTRRVLQALEDRRETDPIAAAALDLMGVVQPEPEPVQAILDLG